MINVMIVFGTRPEAIKIIPIIKNIAKRTDMKPIIVSTGQHKEMLNQILKDFSIAPDHTLDVMMDNQSLTGLTIKIIDRLTPILKKEKPDILLVHGDTTTTFAAALAAFYQKIPIGHVEAGLRTWDKYSPFPEEENRQLTDRLSDIFFAPTIRAKENLKLENINSSVFITGNTAIDTIKYTVSDHYKNPLFETHYRTVLLTMHRRENIGEPMKQVFSAVNRITNKYKDIKFVFPCHKNPKVKNIADQYFKTNDNVSVIEPVGVFDLHNMIKRSFLVLTDSGGIQEETPSFNVPVLVLRNTTERPEGIECGVSKLIGTQEETIFKEISNLIDDKNQYLSMCKNMNPYGDGYASERITAIIKEYFEKNDSTSVWKDN